MAAEPKKKIEDLLHAYSRKRKEDAGAPLEMHPATRRMLQGEVARLAQEGKSGAEPRRWWAFLLVGPRLAGAVGVFAVLLVGVWVIVQNERGQKSRMAEMTSEAPAPVAGKPLTDERLQAKGDSRAEADAVAEDREERVAKKVEAPQSAAANFGNEVKMQSRDAKDAPAPSAAPDPRNVRLADQLDRESQARLRYDAPADKLGAVTSGDYVAAPDAEKNVRMANEGKANAVGTDRFYQFSESGQVAQTEWAAAVPGSNQPARGLGVTTVDGLSEFKQHDASSPALLRKFVIEETNGKIRIRDEDGSVYEGEVLAKRDADVNTTPALADAASSTPAKEERRDLRRNLDESRVAPRSFRASGVSQRFKQRVVINGELEDGVERLAAVGGKVVSEPTLAKSPAAGSPPSAPQITAPTSGVRSQTDSPRQAESAGIENLYRHSAITGGVGGGSITSTPAFRPATLRARVQVGATNELNLKAVRTR